MKNLIVILFLLVSCDDKSSSTSYEETLACSEVEIQNPDSVLNEASEEGILLSGTFTKATSIIVACGGSLVIDQSVTNSEAALIEAIRLGEVSSIEAI